MGSHPSSKPDDSPTDIDRPEFSRIVHLADLARQDLSAEWTASPDECAALARRFDLPVVHKLSARVSVTALGGGGALAEIAFAADVEQRSVVSLENVRQQVGDTLTVRYLPEAKVAAYEALLEAEGEAAAEEDIEPISGESIDIGETIAQQLSLALDPYPRQAGEKFEDYWDSTGGTDRPEGRNPFEILKNFKQDT